jgi:hypothetical protein
VPTDGVALRALQVVRAGFHVYLHSFWNRVDIALLSVQGMAACLRLTILCEDLSATSHASVDAVYMNETSGVSREPADVESEKLHQTFFDCLTIGLILFILRSTEILNYHEGTGEIFMIVREMIYESTPVLLYMFVFAALAGIAFSAGRPPPTPTAGMPYATAAHTPPRAPLGISAKCPLTHFTRAPLGISAKCPLTHLREPHLESVPRVHSVTLREPHLESVPSAHSLTLREPHLESVPSAHSLVHILAAGT